MIHHTGSDARWQQVRTGAVAGEKKEGRGCGRVGGSTSRLPASRTGRQNRESLRLSPHVQPAAPPYPSFPPNSSLAAKSSIHVHIPQFPLVRVAFSLCSSHFGTGTQGRQPAGRGALSHLAEYRIDPKIAAARQRDSALEAAMDGAVNEIVAQVPPYTQTQTQTQTHTAPRPRLRPICVAASSMPLSTSRIPAHLDS